MASSDIYACVILTFWSLALCYGQFPFQADYYIPMEDKTGGGGNVGLQDVNGGPTVVQGVVGNALHYQGYQASKMGSWTRSNCFEDIEKCPDGFTVAFWVKFGSFNERQVIDTGGYAGLSRGWDFRMLTDRKVFSHLRLVSGGLGTRAVCDVFMEHQWRHVVIRYNLTNAVLFLDGRSISEDGTKNVDSSGNNNPQPYIGRTTNGRLTGWNDMYVDELMHWNKPISDELIQSISQRPAYGNNTGLKTGLFKPQEPCATLDNVEVDDVTVTSRLECVNRCAVSSCKSFYYHSGNGSCITHTTGLPAWKPTDLNWKFYVLL